MTKTKQHVEDDIRAAVDSGTDIYQKVQAITLKALTDHELDLENIKSVVQSAGKGINAGLVSQNEQAQDAFKQAASALDDTLAKTVEASKLAIEEAASRVSDFSHDEVSEATDALKTLESLFIETMQTVAQSGNHMVRTVVEDFISHTQRSGTAVGEQTLLALDALKQLPTLGKDTVVSSTLATTKALAQISSGFLSGIAESIQSAQTKKHND